MAANTEGKAVLAALKERPSDTPTACEPWTAHDVAAHLAGGSKEIADIIEAKLDGQPGRPTRGFEEREAPFRAMPYDDVIARLVAESKRKLAAYDALASSPGAMITFTGTTLGAVKLAMRSRCEAALHRWDLVGSDELSRDLLSQPELITHAVWVLNSMPTLQETVRALGARAAAAEFTDHCHAHDQTRPTPLIFRYVADDFNALHQDVYGDVGFPFQVLTVLSWPGEDFTGGEFLLVTQFPRAQAVGELITPGRGQLLIFPNARRPVYGSRGWYTANVRHGVSRVRSGTRYTLGVIFHDAR